MNFRIIFICILLCGSLIHWHWKASIISHLSVDIPAIPFRSSAELLESDYQITLHRDTAVHLALENASTGILKELWDSKFLNKDLSLKDCLDGIISKTPNTHAMCVPTEHVYYLEEYKDCLITDTGCTLLSANNAFAFSKGSPFRDLFNHAMSKMIENGELEKIKAKYKINEPECNGSSGTSLGFKNVICAFYIFLAGLVVCTLVFVFELYRVKLIV